MVLPLHKVATLTTIAFALFSVLTVLRPAAYRGGSPSSTKTLCSRWFKFVPPRAQGAQSSRSCRVGSARAASASPRRLREPRQTMPRRVSLRILAGLALPAGPTLRLLSSRSACKPTTPRACHTMPRRVSLRNLVGLRLAALAGPTLRQSRSDMQAHHSASLPYHAAAGLVADSGGLARWAR